MPNIKRKIVIALVAAALSSTALIAQAMAECKVVKEDPECWGDTCATKTVCTPGPAWKYEAKKFPPIGSESGQTSDAWLNEKAKKP